MEITLSIRLFGEEGFSVLSNIVLCCLVTKVREKVLELGQPSYERAFHSECL